MTSERVALIRRLDAVEREYGVTRLAVDRLLAARRALGGWVTYAPESW